MLRKKDIIQENYYKYFEQAKLMLSILPIVGQEKEFALKGGTALNFFYLNLPRLSVDIDLTFLPVKPRDETLKDITNSLSRISDKVKRLFPLCQSCFLQTFKILDRRLKLNSMGLTDGQRHQDISHEPPWHPPGQDCKKMGVNQASIHNHLLKMATLPNLINADLRVTFRLARGFTVAQVAQKHGWTDS